MGDVDIRAVAPEEHDVAGEVVVAAYRAVPGSHMSGGYEDELRAVGRRASEADVLVAVEDGRILGCVTFVRDASSPWAEQLGAGESAIRMMAVVPAARGRGVGAALLSACVERARAAGSAALFLHSTPLMTVAHRLYERAGFVRAPERDWSPRPEVPLLAFRLDLSG